MCWITSHTSYYKHNCRIWPKSWVIALKRKCFLDGLRVEGIMEVIQYKTLSVRRLLVCPGTFFERPSEEHVLKHSTRCFCFWCSSVFHVFILDLFVWSSGLGELGFSCAPFRFGNCPSPSTKNVCLWLYSIGGPTRANLKFGLVRRIYINNTFFPKYGLPAAISWQHQISALGGKAERHGTAKQ